VKIVAREIAHKTDVGGVVLCRAEAAEVEAAHARVLANVRALRPEVRQLDVLVEERITAPGLELVVTVRRDAAMGLVTVIGRGGVHVEIDRDYAVHAGLVDERDVAVLVAGLRCAPLISGHRGRPPLALGALAAAVVRLQAGVLARDVTEIELNPVLLTAGDAWVLDALVLSG
jgi:succinyl-CoA synthetase beta subunit